MLSARSLMEPTVSKAEAAQRKRQGEAAEGGARQADRHDGRSDGGVGYVRHEGGSKYRPGTVGRAGLQGGLAAACAVSVTTAARARLS
jgi:hypothetical protein